jgi:hypothetical protein
MKGSHKGPRPQWKEALKVTCPTCGVGVDKTCMAQSRGEWVIVHAHKARIELSKAIAKGVTK